MAFRELTMETFLQGLASKDPVPGGGGASALVGSIGMALGNMVGSLTLGKKKYAAVEEDIIRLKAEATALQEELLFLIDEDARVFAPLAKAYGLPKETPEQQAQKAEVMEACLREACLVPLKIMQVCAKAILLQQEFAEKGSLLALSDAGVGVIFCKAALQGASLNVFINTGAMQDRDYAKKIEEEAEDLLAKYTGLAEEIFCGVRERL
ncbi:MAG: cyclodeaminase/cyclohydrolase family protein [Anaerovoracaceae bacterium]